FIQAKTRLNTHRPYYSKYIDALISVMLLFNMAVCVYEGNIAPHRLKNLFSISNHLDRTPIKYSPYLKRTGWQFIDTHIAPSEPVAYLGHYDSWIFPYYDNRLTRKIYHLPTLEGFRLVRKKNKKMKLLFTPAFKESLKQRGIHYIHLNLERYRHRRDKGRDILIEDTDVCRVSPNLFYLKF
ncbi:MAG: hypothetical protein GY950_06810, partial [bacterium]|nr:hypothetical protein [bacterium]